MLSKMNFSNLMNDEDVEVKRVHSDDELEAAAQLILFNLSSTNSTEEIECPSSPQEDSDDVSNLKSDDELQTDNSSLEIFHSNKRKRDSYDKDCVGDSINSDSNSPPKKPRRKRPCVFTDITHLLTLPQKEAARILGISESMLCKRFKEQTQRKWPYRYLRKVERQMALKRKSKKLSAEDLKRLEHLESERNKCLASVQIRLRPATFAAYSDGGKTEYLDNSADSDSETL